MIINLLLLCIIVNLIFISGFMNSLKWLIGKIVGIRNYHDINMKPLFCPLCLSFWTQVLYLIFTHQLTIASVCIAIIFANMIDVIEELFYTIKELILRFIKIFSKL